MSTSPPVVLPTDDNISRALNILDRTPVVDLHKIGIVYVGPGQSDEVGILANTHGSQLYTAFLHSLGRLIHLTEAPSLGIYTGGLDTSPDAIDGKYGVAWQDGSSNTQMMFHITTLMPTSLERDPRCSLKKRHIGNDFVAIAFDESGLDTFGFNTLPGQFNFVNIVIKPIPGCLISLEDDVDVSDKKGNASHINYERRWFYVETKFKDGLNLPTLSVLSDGRIVSGRELAGVVRRAALHANMLALVVAQSGAGGGMFTSNARERLQQIKRLADRVKKLATGAFSSEKSEKPGSQYLGSSAMRPVQVDTEVALDFTRFT
jgi:hypothetical protein